jgi:hypothetical protein
VKFLRGLADAASTERPLLARVVTSLEMCGNMAANRRPAAFCGGLQARSRISGGAFMSLSRVFAAGFAAASLGGCMATSETVQMRAPAQTAALPSAYPIEKMFGRWGVASYRDDKDRARTEAMARAHCRNPYVIEKGATDGVMMHVADDPKVYELTFKGAPNGKTYLGFNAPPGDPQDREVVSFSDNLVVLRFVDAEINNRYGIYVYVRCTQRA